MRLAAYKYGTLQVEPMSSATFLAIKHSQRTKIRKFIKLERGPKNLWAKYGPIDGLFSWSVIVGTLAALQLMDNYSTTS
jgi:hypothetical protein